MRTVWLWALAPALVAAESERVNDLRDNCQTEEPQRLADPAQLALLDKVHVVYSGDRRSLEGLMSSMLSLARHLRAPERCVVHLIVDPGDLGLARRIVKVFRLILEGAPALPNVTLHELRPLRIDIGSFEAPWFRPELLKRQNYVRYYLHEYLPDASRALWLDTDTIVQADVAPLYQMHMQHALAARPFPRRGHMLMRDLRERFRRFAYRSPRRHWDFPNTSLDLPTFSTGVLLYDLERWRSGDLTRALERWSFTLMGFMGTQLVMGVEFVAKFDAMDWWWNVEGLGIVTSHLPQHCIDGGKILHWSGPHKPWVPRSDHWVWGKWVRDHDYLFEAHSVSSSWRCARHPTCRRVWRTLAASTADFLDAAAAT